MKAVLLKTNVEGIEKRHFFRENIYVLGYFWFLVLQTLKLNEGPPFFFFFFFFPSMAVCFGQKELNQGLESALTS